MTITATCPTCTGHFSFEDHQTGIVGSCPHCQARIKLTVPAPPPAPAPRPAPAGQPAPARPSSVAGPLVQKAFETRAEFLQRIRAESSYKTARQLAMLVFGLIGLIAVVAMVVCVFLVFVDSRQAAAGIGIAIAAGAVLVVLALAGYQSAVVIFDISDALIEGRGK